MPPAEGYAVAFLLATLAIALFACLAVAIRELVRPPLSPIQNFLWWTAQVVTRLWWRTTFPEQYEIPTSGAVLISNHRSSVDPIFTQVLVRRVVHWMVAREFCEFWAFSWLLKILEVIPVGRGGIDTASTKQAIRIVQQGGLVGMFPEGRINLTDELLLPGRPGAVLVAIKARAPIVPCYVEGSPYNQTPWSPLLMPARVRLRMGSPIHLDAYFDRDVSQAELGEIMKRCLTAIARLAEQPDFEPQIAGRRWKPTKAELDADLAAARRARRHS